MKLYTYMYILPILFTQLLFSQQQYKYDDLKSSSLSFNQEDGGFMRKLISILAAVLLCTTFIFPQAKVDIPLIVTDNITDTMTIYFGLDSTATNGIDPQLGEGDIYGFNPPPGVFEGRFDLSSYAGTPLHSYKDYRNAPSFPYTGERQHRLIWQLGYLGSFLSINYNLPGYASMQIEDEFGGIFVNSPNLTGSGTFIITVPINAVKLNITYTNAIPVELTSFTGIREGSNVKLEWTTSSELNNKGFNVEKRFSDSDWEVIAFIDGNGTTTEVHAYSYYDDLSNNIITGQLFYRLKQIDYSGAAAYSEELKIEEGFTTGNYVLDQNYPNPFNPSTSISYSLPEYSNVTIKIFNLLGNEIATLVDAEKPAGTYDVTWNAANYPSGIYFYKLQAGSFSEMKKMILLK